MNNPPNAKLNKAKATKNDEFYTNRKDIDEELSHYEEQFDNKTVYLPCDDYRWSEFYAYFRDNFEKLNLKKLVATNYVPKPEVDLYALDTNVSVVYPTCIVLTRQHSGTKTEEIYHLYGDGDFRSDECVDLLKQCDVVVTNPPFSLFREFVALLLQHKKDFLIIGSISALKYKQMFSLLRDNKIRLGNRQNQNMRFRSSPTSKDYCHQVPATWFTTMNVKPIPFITMTETFSPEVYPKYGNYSAINVDKSKHIPCDYYGLIGVPITFMLKHNAEQFDIIDIVNNLKIDDKKIFSRIIIKRRK